jgi:uncharacterized protein
MDGHPGSAYRKICSTDRFGERMNSHQRSIGEVAALGLIKAYQYGIRPMLGPRCRFFPSCSEYAADAIGVYGVLRGSAMGAVRLAKCHPWHSGGYDPVPEKSHHSAKACVASNARPASNNP